jgi:proliferating cell nuclear antigen
MLFTLEKNKKVATLIELFKVIKGLNDFCKMYCKQDELFIQIMDDSHVCLLEVKIKKDWFASYESEDEVVSFNSKILTIIMGLHTLDSIVTFETNDDCLNITFEQKDKTEKSFQINLIDLDSDVMESQEIEHSLEFSINARKLDQYFNEMQSFGDTLELVHVNDTIYMRSQGDEGKYVLKITDDLLDDLIVEEELQMVCKVPMRFTSLVTKLYSVFKKITVCISEDAPFTLKIFPLEEEEKNLLGIKFFIAPKVEDENKFDFSEFEEKELMSSNNVEEELENYKNEVIER